MTIGTGNGLSVSTGQVLSLALASSVSVGALSAADWNIFNDKIDFTSLSGTGFILYDNLTGTISWTGSTSGITEGTNLYFTDSRAQNALSGTVSTLSGRILGLENQLSSLSGNLLSIATTLSSLSGTVADNSALISSLSGNLAVTNSTLSNLSLTVDVLSGSLL